MQNPMETAGFLMVVSLMLLAIFAPVVAPHDPVLAVANTFGDPAAPSRAFPLGTDQLGRDVLSRIIFGARISLTVGIAAMLVTVIIGVAVGLLSGFFGGAVDFVLMRFTDIMLTLPALLLAMALVAVLRPSLLNILIVIGLVSWTGVARVVRAETLSMVQRDFVLAARALGARHIRILLREILPNVVLPVGSYAFLIVAAIMVAEGSLSFLGLGIPPPAPSWGGMIASGKDFLSDYPWEVFVPAAPLLLSVLAFNVIGDWGRRRFDVQASKL